jgi:hypothetical protein
LILPGSSLQTEVRPLFSAKPSYNPKSVRDRFSFLRELATTKYRKNGGTSIATYAGAIGRSMQTVHHEVAAYEVYSGIYPCGEP